MRLRQWKHGDNYPNENIGGDLLTGRGILLGTQTEPRETRKFLEGILTKEQRFDFYIDYEIFNGFFLSGAASHQITNVEGEETTFNEFHFGVKLDY